MFLAGIHHHTDALQPETTLFQNQVIMLLNFFTLKSKQQAKTILEALSKEFKIVKEPPRRESRLYYDTFDWRLFRRESYFYRTGNRYVLCSNQTDRILNSTTTDITGDYPFVANFPRSSFRNRLENLISIRALLPLFHENMETNTAFLLNEDEKIVVRLFIQNSNLTVGKRKIQVNPVINVEAVRGYRTEEMKVLETIQKLGLIKTAHSKFQQMVNHSGKKPLDYSSKIKIELQKEMTVGEAVRRILLQYVSIIKQNEAGIRSDIDSEFLHDFRVAIRRTRSLLSETKHDLPLTALKDFRKKLAEVQKSTNLMRDLDVYLLKEPYYKGILPLKLRKSLTPLFTEIQQARKEEHQKVTQLLKTKDYRSFINQWSAFLISDQILQVEKSHRPVLPFAKKVISKRLKIVLQNGSMLLKGNPEDQHLHALRIECKKLRYLLEFFSSLFQTESIKKVVDQLKQLQDLLGEYNDLAIQSADLQQRLELLNAPDKVLKDTSAALGGLMTIFYQEQNVLKKRFKETFVQFSNSKQLEIYHNLFTRTY